MSLRDLELLVVSCSYSRCSQYNLLSGYNNWTIQLIGKTYLLLYLGGRSCSWNPFQTRWLFIANAYKMHSLVLAFSFLGRMPGGVEAISLCLSTHYQRQSSSRLKIYTKLPLSYYPLGAVEETVLSELERTLCFSWCSWALGEFKHLWTDNFSYLSYHIVFISLFIFAPVSHGNKVHLWTFTVCFPVTSAIYNFGML